VLVGSSLERAYLEGDSWQEVEVDWENLIQLDAWFL
jgi:hypothetical protein